MFMTKGWKFSSSLKSYKNTKGFQIMEALFSILDDDALLQLNSSFCKDFCLVHFAVEGFASRTSRVNGDGDP